MKWMMGLVCKNAYGLSALVLGLEIGPGFLLIVSFERSASSTSVWQNGRGRERETIFVRDRCAGEGAWESQ